MGEWPLSVGFLISLGLIRLFDILINYLILVRCTFMSMM